MAEGQEVDEWGIWLFLECVPPFLIVFMVWPLTVMAGPYTMDHVIHVGEHTLASGEMPAVAFCALLPMAFVAFRARLSSGVKANVVFGAFGAFGFYWLTKFRPALPSEGVMPEAGQALVYSAFSLVLALFSISTAIYIKKASNK